MQVLYHLTIKPPKRPCCEAISQEIAALREHFTGKLLYLNPNQHAPVYIPRLLFGFHNLRELRTLEADIDLHHIYNPDPYPFPILRLLRRPVVYSLTGGIGEKRIDRRFFSSLAAVTVMDRGSLQSLQFQGLENVHLVRPGIDVKRFTRTQRPLGSEIHLLVGSAPWTRDQFKTKGVDALLDVARLDPRLHLIFLWRGVLTEEIKHRVRRLGVEDRVEILDRVMDINEVLARVHASVTLASEPDIIKAYPHSLLESLAAGKPVLISRAIPMADYVEEKGCGVVIEGTHPADIITAVERLKQDYKNLQESAQQIDAYDFSQQQMIESYKKVYEHLFRSTH